MLADLAEGAGFNVRYLGASVPVDALVEAIDQLARRRGLRLMVGGSGVPQDVRADPRVVYAPDVREAIGELEPIAAER
jgi:methanogenic corrinoid protein MtbC1